MRKMAWLGVALLLAGLPLATAWATGWRKDTNEAAVLNLRLHGKIIDHTANHGVDRRIWSRSLYQRRDLYVYLPPHYDPHQRYPFMIWLHGYGQDEQSFLHHVIPMLDEAICAGKLPPLIIAAPDGSLKGEPCCTSPGSFFLNSKAGDFEDFVLQDVWDFVCHHYPIRAERGAHIIAGVTVGGFAAYNYALKHRECFGVVIGVHPLLNLRWVDKKGHYHADFDPCDWGWRTDLTHSHLPIGCSCCGLVPVTMHHLLEPVFGCSEEGLAMLMCENPIELVDRTHLHNGELEMYVAFAGHDEFNIDAQVESFLYLCKCRGLCVGVGYDKHGHHCVETAKKLLPGILEWLAPRIGPYCVTPCTECCTSCAAGPEGCGCAK